MMIMTTIIIIHVCKGALPVSAHVKRIHMCKVTAVNPSSDSNSKILDLHI